MEIKPSYKKLLIEIEISSTRGLMSTLSETVTGPEQEHAPTVASNTRLGCLLETAAGSVLAAQE